MSHLTTLIQSQAIWEPREGYPEARAHWDSIRSRHGFGDTKNIKPQPLAHEQLPVVLGHLATAQKRIAVLERQLNAAKRLGPLSQPKLSAILQFIRWYWPRIGRGGK